MKIYDIAQEVFGCQVFAYSQVTPSSEEDVIVVSSLPHTGQ